jgi:hypothetical protein
MNIIIHLGFLRLLNSGDFLTYLALVLAYTAYVWSIDRDLKSWKSLFQSLDADLSYASEWLSNEYFEDTYKDKTSYSPRKIILPLFFESLPEIIRRGVAELPRITEDFVKNLSLFNERVGSFNCLLEQVRKAVSANPILTEKLNREFSKFNLHDNEFPDFDEFKKNVQNSAKDGIEIYYLAENIRRLNRVIHVNLIGNYNTKDRLHYLYTYIKTELFEITRSFDNRKPWFVKYKNYLVLTSIPTFIFIEWLFGTFLNK